MKERESDDLIIIPAFLFCCKEYEWLCRASVQLCLPSPACAALLSRWYFGTG